MLPPIEYLAWAQAHYAGVRFDLASSGLRELAPAELGTPAFAPNDPEVWTAYRDAVASRYGVAPSCVVPSLGASGGLFVAYAALFDRGEEILVEEPTYEPMVRVGEALGLVVKRFPRRAERGFSVTIDDVLGAMSDRTRGVIVTDLHNPTGVALDHDVVAALAAELAKRRAHLVVDEVYAELAGSRRTAKKHGPNVTITSSLTKCFGLGWARAGFVLLPEDRVESANRALLHVAGNLPGAVAAWGVLAFSQIGRLEARRRDLQRGKRAVVDAFLARHAPTLRWTPPHPNAQFGFVEDTRGKNVRALLERGAATHGVLAAAGEFFSMPNGFRLAWTLGAEDLPEALGRLEEVLDLRR